MGRKTWTFLFLFIGVSLFAGGIPKWYKSGKLRGFSLNENIIGVGLGNTYNKAVSEAQNQIGGQIQVDISSEIEMLTEESQYEGVSHLKNQFTKKIETTIQQSIKGVEIVKREKKENNYYVFAVLNKKRFANSLKSELDQLWMNMSMLVKDAHYFMEEGNILSAIDAYTELQPYTTEFYSKKSLHDAFVPTPYSGHGDFSFQWLLEETQTLLSSLRIKVESGDKQSTLAGGPLSNPVIFSVFIKPKIGTEIPVTNLPVIIKYSNGSIIDRSISDSFGQVQCYAIGNPTGPKGGQIVASLSLSGLAPHYKQYLKNAKAIASYNITDSPPIAFTLRVVDENDTRLKKVENKLIKNIEKMGYSVGPDAELALDGNVTIIDEKEVDGKSGRQYLVTAELDMFMIVKMNGEKVASFDAKGKGLSKKNIKDANKKAFQKLKLSKKNLAGMLSEADEELKRIFKKKSAEKLREGKALYDQGKLKKAIVPLTKVTHDEGQVEEAIKLIGEIKVEINRIESERLARIDEEKRKKREHEMELAEMAAETERARQKAELEMATTMAAAQVSSAQISADADVMVAKYGVDQAEMNARAAEASAMAEEAKIAIEQVKKETEQVKLNQLKAQESIIVAESEAEVAKTNAIAFAARLAEKQGSKTDASSVPLTKEEESLVGDWNYLGTINPTTADEDYSGAGSIFTISKDRTFSDEGTNGTWSVNNESFLVNNSYPIPFSVDGANLIMSVDVNGTQYLRIYEKY
jgi:hypothetical protein